LDGAATLGLASHDNVAPTSRKQSRNVCAKLRSPQRRRRALAGGLWSRPLSSSTPGRARVAGGPAAAQLVPLLLLLRELADHVAHGALAAVHLGRPQCHTRRRAPAVGAVRPQLVGQPAHKNCPRQQVGNTENSTLSGGPSSLVGGWGPVGAPAGGGCLWQCEARQVLLCFSVLRPEWVFRNLHSDVDISAPTGCAPLSPGDLGAWEEAPQGMQHFLSVRASRCCHSLHDTAKALQRPRLRLLTAKHVPNYTVDHRWRSEERTPARPDTSTFERGNSTE